MPCLWDSRILLPRLFAAALRFPSVRTSLPFFLFQSIGGRSAAAHCSGRLLSSAAPLLTPCDAFSQSFFDFLLQGCCDARQARVVHSRIVTSGALHGSAFLDARLVSVYSRVDLPVDARSVFRMANERNSCLLWNSILRMYLFYSHHGEALALYHQMGQHGVAPDGFTFPIILRCCASIGNASLCKSVHAHAVAAGYSSHLHVNNELVFMYGKMGNMDMAQLVFESMTVRSVVSWNTLLSSFSLNADFLGASSAFRRMEREGYDPNAVTWTSLLSAHARSGQNGIVLELFSEMRARGVGPTPETLSVVLAVCTDMGASSDGKAIHSFIIRDGIENYVFVRNSLICLYGRLGHRGDAEHLFLQTKVKTLVSWNALISCYAGDGLCNEAYEVFLQLEKMPDVRPNLVSWSAVIGGFAAAGKVEQALQLFRQMLGTEIGLTAITVTTILSVCAEIPALSLGKELHGHITRILRDDALLVGNGLINMYAKCGSIRDACLVFARLEKKDLISWNSMISGYGVNGCAENALHTFYDLVDTGFEPDGVTFVAVLSACVYAGYVTEGRQLFQQMICKYKLSPWLEHYACMVDLFSRAGLLEEAKKLSEKMPLKPNVCVWGALLNSCRIHSNEQIVEDAAFHIATLEMKTAGTYIMLSNIYASCGKWEDSASMRVLTKEKRLKKRVGQSWIELNNKIYVFSSGIPLHPGLENIYIVLLELNQLLQSEEHAAAYDQMLNCLGVDRATTQMYS